MQAVLVMFRSDGERRSFSLSREMTVIGRRQDCDLMIPLNEISRKHCRFIKEGDSLRLEDLGSSNGTFCNGRRVQEAVLQPGDTVQVGPVTFVIQIDGEPHDDEIQPFANAAGAAAGGTDDDEIEELPDEDEAAPAPARGGGKGRGAAVAKGLAAGAAIGAGAAAIAGAAGRRGGPPVPAGMGDQSDDALEELPDDDLPSDHAPAHPEDDLLELPDDEAALEEIPSEDDLMADLKAPAAAGDDEPMELIEDEVPSPPPAPAAVKRPAPPAPPAPVEDELDELEEEAPAAGSEAPIAMHDDSPIALHEEEPLALDDEPLGLHDHVEAEADDDSLTGEAPAAVEGEGEEPLEEIGETEPLALDEPISGAGDDSLALAEPMEIAAPGEPLGGAPHALDLAEPEAGHDPTGAAATEPLALDQPIGGEDAEGDEPLALAEGEAGEELHPLELAEDELGEPPAEPLTEESPALDHDLAIGHHEAGNGQAPAGEPAPGHEPIGTLEEDALGVAQDDLLEMPADTAAGGAVDATGEELPALEGEDAPLDFSESEDLLELADDPDHPHAGGAGASEDDLLDLLGEAPKPDANHANGSQHH